MFRVCANNPQDSLSFDNLAMTADPSYRRFNFHIFIPSFIFLLYLFSIFHLLFLLTPECNPAAAQIVGRQFNFNFIAGQYPYKMHPYLTGHMS